MIVALKERLNQELEEIVEELTVRIPERLGEDQSQTAYQTVLELQRHLQQRVQFLHQVIAGLDTVDPATLEPGLAGLGSTVRVRDLRSGETLDYTLMVGEPNLDTGEISLGSPVGQALMGRVAGEDVEVITPQGKRRLRVLKVTPLAANLAEEEEEEDLQCA
jgi:transcription elongation factor GreA